MILDVAMLPSCFTFICWDILHTLVRYDYYCSHISDLKDEKKVQCTCFKKSIHLGVTHLSENG